MVGELRKGINIISPFSEGALVGARLSLSSGTSLADDLIRSPHGYRIDAVVPKPPWRELSPSEENLLHDTLPLPGQWIKIIKCPEYILRPFAFIKFLSAHCSSKEEIMQINRSVDFLHGVELVKRYLAHGHTLPGSFLEGAGFDVIQPGLVTGTLDSETGRYVGLHVDTWYSAALADRPFSPTRICINLGCETRSFLFVNLPLSTMVAVLAKEDYASPEKFNSRDLIKEFLANFPDYPVIRLKVAPGEAYLAHTENIIHDGSTGEQKHWDITLTIRGNFRP